MAESPIPIHLAVEDSLSDAVLRSLLLQTGRRYVIGHSYSKGGFGYLRRIVNGLNNAAHSTPFLVLTDLDTIECPPLLIRNWLLKPKHPNLIFRVATRQVESWILAHRQAFAAFARIRVDQIPIQLDEIENSKKLMISLVRRSPKRALRDAIVPQPGSTARQGPDYNSPLVQFVMNVWRADIAANHSQSLDKTYRLLKSFVPTWMKPQL